MSSCEGGTPCANGVRDLDESDVDCGGSCGATCATGHSCGGARDCQSGVCDKGQCAAPACDDLFQNGDESDVDCGGSCSGCEELSRCAQGTDCLSGSCIVGLCARGAVSEVTPALGECSGGTAVTLRGTGFASKPPLEVLFDGQKGSGLLIMSDGALQVFTPAHQSAGLVDVTAVYGDGQRTTIQKGYRYFFGQVAFSAGTRILPWGIPKQCEDIAVADLNKDGKADIILLCWGWTSSIATLQTGLSNGDGSFRMGAVQSISGRTGRMIVADFNKDGQLDLAVTFWGLDKLGVFLGRGNGSFAPGVYYAAQDFPVPLGAGDFDQDGWPDLVVVNQQVPFLCFYRNRQDGSFAAPRCDALPGAPGTDVAIADYDQNGGLDVAITSDQGLGSIIVMFNNYNGYFTKVAGISAATIYDSLASADVNGDGIADLIAGTRAAPYEEHVRLGQGDGSFAAAILAQSFAVHQAYDKALSDYDSDGISDLAGIGYNSSQASVLLGKPANGSYVLGAQLFGDNCRGIASGDFDGDGRKDIAVSCFETGGLYIYLNQSR